MIKKIGILLIIGGLVLISMIYLPIVKEEFSYQASIAQSRISEEKIIPKSRDFGLVIPRIQINEQIFSGIDPTNPSEYLPVLTQGVAQARGSAFPGKEGNVFIFAHSSDTPLNITRYNAVFYLIGKLNPSDEIIIYYQKRQYTYQVTDKKILSPKELEEFLGTLEGKTLTLQTCYPPGTTLKRLIVIAKEAD
ncbi:MAG TPA: sortase [Patescibacteria group bacterium]|nr:sortase [Patescibacteria group bacterium]